MVFIMILPINKEIYVKKVNAYLLFYKVLEKTRKWYQVAPYELSEVLDLVPSKLLKNYDELPNKYFETVMKLCF